MIAERAADGVGTRCLFMQLPDHFERRVISVRDKLPSSRGVGRCMTWFVRWNALHIKHCATDLQDAASDEMSFFIAVAQFLCWRNWILVLLGDTRHNTDQQP